MLIDVIKECSKCGKCRSVCPVFLATNDEVMSPRGRISLIEALLEGDLSISEGYVDTIRACIKCSRCSNVCPVSIKMEQVTQTAREMLAEQNGIPDAAREVFGTLLLEPEAFHSALTDAADSQTGSGTPVWQLPLFFHDHARVPELAAEPALHKYPEYIKSGGQGRVVLFLGCSMNYVNTDIVDSTIEALGRAKIDIFLPKDQVCCGAPAMLYGDTESARELAKRNLTALKADEFDAIITLCPACGVTLAREYEGILGHDVDDFAGKVYDISQFIDKFTDYETRPTDMTVTYHDPCYLRLGQGVEAEPRNLLAKSARFVEMENAGKCCGLGGSLGLFQPELSTQMAQAKIEAIAESEADVVATGCPGCILFLREQLAEKGIEKEVLHTVQILHRAGI